ncbi:tyrosine-type recombinase/integrase [Marinicaulis aureus]|uniref:Tyrosine-type recombinase/integrase n=1 Tax=Hyphococcus aureus TaxID=2666033 RepID=A0ABW1L3K5_9PROT
MSNVKYNQLSARRVASLSAPGKYADGNCLNLVIDERGNKRWVVIVAYLGKRREIGAGSAREVSLAEARARRDEIKRHIRNGVDPLAEKQRARAVPTFEAFSRDLYDEIKHEWRNEKHATAWLRTLELYAFPHFGSLMIDAVDGPTVTGALKKIWKDKPETARRVKQRVGRVLSAAIAENLRPGPNPVDDIAAALSKKRAPAVHLRSMPYADVPAFYARLRKSEMALTSKAAFRLLILTAARTGEIRFASWSEIDLRKKLWTIPSQRMKAGETHVVPLCAAAISILKEVRSHSGRGDLVFPANADGGPYSDAVFAAALKRMGEPFTAHGFRSSFRTWAEEQTAYPHAAMEAALAHKIPDRVEAAYRRTTLLEKRRELMADWEAFVTRLSNGN